MDRRDVAELELKNRKYALRRFRNKRFARKLVRVFEGT